MERKHSPPDDPGEWLIRAKSSLAHARSIATDVRLEELCFDAQQAAEKAIKAVFVLRREAFPFVHELKKLLSRLERTGQKIPKYLWKANELSPYAVETRYPGFSDRVTRGEYRRAVRIAENVVRWAERQIDQANKARKPTDPCA